MVKIFINAPFKYTFQGRTKYAIPGELVFDLSKISHREELRLLLSPTFGFRKFIRADDNIIRILNSNDFDEDELPSYYPSIIESPSSFLQPPQEPEENPFIPKYESSPSTIVDTSSSIYFEELPTEPQVNISSDISQLSDSSSTIDTGKIEKRYEELNVTHWSKVKMLAEEQGIIYTTKQEVIDTLLMKEYGISKGEIDGILLRVN